MNDAELLEKATKGRWDPKRAWDWYNALPWLVGCNFLPSSAVNQLEMWQADTFNPKEIDRELGWLANLGMNSMRVFLHDLLWMQDAKAFLARVEQFLDLAHRHKIGIMFVFFDSVWNPFPYLGKQRDPEPGLHNSFWVQSPGRVVLENEKEWARLEDYLCGFVGHFRDDSRVQIWDIWNEPDNNNGGTYGPRDLGFDEKAKFVLPLMAQAFEWVRSAKPSQPLTTGMWLGAGEAWKDDDKLPLFHKVQLHASDVISFHRYDPLVETRTTVELLKEHGRPILCTEYMARRQGSTFEAVLPYFKREKIAAYNWGAVDGKSQTIYQWDSWQKPYRSEPVPWHHDIFRRDGMPYDPGETDLIKSLLKK